MVQRGCSPNTSSFCTTLNSMLCNDNKSKCSCGICSEDICNDDSIEMNSYGSGLNSNVNFDIMNLIKENNDSNMNQTDQITCFSCNGTASECDSSRITTKACEGSNNDCLVVNFIIKINFLK
jgi:hypothetical protein